MKLAVLFMVLGLLQVAARTTAQVTLKETSTPLAIVLKQIQKQSGYDLGFNENLVKAKGKPVTVNVNNVPVEEALKEVFKYQDELTYSLNGKIIGVREKEKKQPDQLTQGLNPGLTITPPPADITVRGKVIDADGNPLAGASVKIKNTTKGTQTNEEGIFTLNNIADNAVLIIEFVGYQRREVLINASQKVYTIRMLRSTSELEEVIVGKGYYEEKQRLSVGNTVRISAKDIEKQPVANPMLALQGRVAGLEVKQLSGMNGGGVQLRVQGQNSIRSGNDPLVIVDGIPYPTQMLSSESVINGGSPLNFINPNDIETIDVLKDADATSIYGSRAANGAIVITTKRGKPGKVQVNLRLQQGWGDVSRKLKLLNARQYLDMRYEAYKNDGINWRDPSVTTATDLKIWDTTRNTDWQNELIGGTASYTNANLSVSGGTSAVQYLIGATWRRSSTVFPGDVAQQFNTVHYSINSSSANRKFNIQLTGSYSFDQNGLPLNDLTNNALQLEPVAPALYNPDGTLNWALNAAGSSTWLNPVRSLLFNDFTAKTRSLVTNAQISYEPVSMLVFKTNVGYMDLRSEYYKPTPLYAFPPESHATATRRSANDYQMMNSLIVEPQVSYANKNGKGSLSVLIGGTISGQLSDRVFIEASGFTSDQLLLNLAAATSYRLEKAQVRYKYAGIFARVNYVWDDEFILNITARRDGSSRFGDNNKYHDFGSVGAGWVFSKRKAIQRAFPFLSFGKLSVSYGTSGSDAISDYQYLSLYYPNSFNLTIPYQGIAGLSAANIGNPNLAWEENRKLNIAADLSFFKDRIKLRVSTGRNRSSNQLLRSPIPTATGFSDLFENRNATVQNTSWEFLLGTTNIQSGEFIWKSSFNLTIPKNKLVKFPNIESSSYANSLIVGRSLNFVAVYPYAGVDPMTGTYTLNNQNGDPSITFPAAASRYYLDIGTKYYGGFSNDFSYKGFTIDLFFQFVRQLASAFYRSATVNPGRFVGGSSNQPIVVLERWQQPGDPATVAKFTSGSSYGGITGLSSSEANYSSDASFIRLKNLSLSWQADEKLVRKMGMNRLNLFCQVQNLFTITQYSWLDPETQTNSLPPLRNVTVGANIGF